MSGRMTRAILNRLIAVFAFALVLLLAGIPASAKDWTSYELGEATLRLPEDWYPFSENPGISIGMSGYDVPYQVIAGWKPSDMPMDENDIVVSHAEMTLAGQRAVLSVIKRNTLGMYLLQFVDLRPEDGLRFINIFTFNGWLSDVAMVFFHQPLCLISYYPLVRGDHLKLSEDPPS